MAVFGTCELLEDILSYLPLKDLFVLQRVSKQWSEVIAGSSVLQEKMFLRLKSTAPKEMWAGTGVSSFVYRYYLRSGGTKKVEPGDPTGFRRINDSSTKHTRLYMPITLNPVLQMSYPLQRTLQRLVGGKREAVSIRVHPAVLYDEHSSLWNMYISDPPCQKVRLKLPIERGSGTQIKADEGLKVGDILVVAARFGDEDYFRFDDTGRVMELKRPNCSVAGGKSIYDIDSVTLCIDLLRDGAPHPVIPSEAERATMVFNYL
jgi:hypothetical protein